VAKYPVTTIQYRAFLEAEDGYRQELWWEQLAEHKSDPGQQRYMVSNRPVENVSWYDAVAFCRWLSDKLGYEIRLPTEWEWQQAASGGDQTKEFPWGATWNTQLANTLESGLNRTTAVGMYPQGKSRDDVLDLSGNVWEWCLNTDNTSEGTIIESTSDRAARGGSCRYDQHSATVSARYSFSPSTRSSELGFRLVSAE
jgi:formylglycine-generating enzyme required for sulfatase activity